MSTDATSTHASPTDANRHELGTRPTRVRRYRVSKGACSPLRGAWTGRRDVGGTTASYAPLSGRDRGAA